MNGRRSGARALVILDISFLAACLITLANVAVANFSASEPTALPSEADARVLALDLYEAERLAISSGQPVDFEFERDDKGTLCGYRVIPARPATRGYRFAEFRRFSPQAQAACAANKITFLPNGRPTCDLSVELTNRDRRCAVEVGRSGEIRIAVPGQ